MRQPLPASAQLQTLWLRIPRAVCDVCLPNYYKTIGVSCILCDGSTVVMVGIPLGCVVLVLLLFCLYRDAGQRIKSEKARVGLERAMQLGASAKSAYDKTSAAIRIVFSYLQASSHATSSCPGLTSPHKAGPVDFSC